MEYSPYTKGEFFKMISANIRQELNPDDFELGEPVPRPLGLNTEITIKPYNSSKLYFNKTMKYNRGDLAGPFMAVVEKGDATDLYGLLDKINEDPVFQINQRVRPDKDLKSVNGIITQEDVFNVELPSHAGRAYIEIPMRAKPQSLFLVGAMFIRILRNP